MDIVTKNNVLLALFIADKVICKPSGRLYQIGDQTIQESDLDFQSNWLLMEIVLPKLFDARPIKTYDAVKEYGDDLDELQMELAKIVRDEGLILLPF